MGRCTTAYVERMTKAEAALRDLLVKLNVGPESDWEEVRETHGAQGGEVEGCGIRRKQRDVHLCLGSWMWGGAQTGQSSMAGDWYALVWHLCSGMCMPPQLLPMFPRDLPSASTRYHIPCGAQTVT